jgi:hypothetical protein
MAIDFEKRVAQYVKLRDMKKEMADRHKAEIAPLNDLMEKLESLFLANLTTQDSAKTKSGTVYKTTKKTASLSSPDEFMHFVIGSGHWDLLDRKANVVAVEEFIEEHKAEPPGVKFTTKEEVGIRRSSK